MSKLARVLHIEAYQLLISTSREEPLTTEDYPQERLLRDLEDRVIRNIRHQFRETIELASAQKKDTLKE
jgi:hypothetical protein